MTIPANKPLRHEFSPAGVIAGTILIVDWNVFDVDEIDVFINSVDTPLIRGTDYNVTLKAPDFQTADITVLAPMATALNGTDNIVIRNDLDFRQGYDASALQDLPPVGLELVLDRLALYSRQLQQDMLESIRFAPGSGITFPGHFPDPVAEKFIRFTDDGLGLIADVDGDTLATAKADADRAVAAAARYLGASATEPTTRIDLSVLQTGDVFFDTATNRFKVWDGSAWVTAVDSSTAIDIVGMAAIGTLAIDDLLPVYDLSLTANRKATVQKLWDSISTLTALGDAPAIGDRIPIRDISAGAGKTITIANLYKAIVNLTLETSPALDDVIPIYDLSATAPRGMVPANLLKVLNLLSEDTDPDIAADFLMTYDISSSAVKKVLLKNIGPELLHVRDEKASGTAGGTFTNGAWRTRVLNTTLTNEITGASLASNQITLPAGTFYCDILAPAHRCSSHTAKLFNVTDTADILIGAGGATEENSDDSNTAHVSGRFTLAASKVLEVQHRCVTTRSADGFGEQAAFGVIEVYADVKIWKVG